MAEEFRLIFDTIPEQFDRYRSRYCPALFDGLIAHAGVNERSSVLELGPGTGQATEPILDTGCDYCAIELGEHLAAKLQSKYGDRSNFRLIRDDFITHSFGNAAFDMIYSAATIQWIPEDIAFSKTFALLKPGGTLAMLLSRGDYKTPNELLYDRIQQVYAEFFRPEQPYELGGFQYANAVRYGYVDFEKREYRHVREFTADEYVAFCGTHCDHLTIPEPHRSRFFDGLRQAIRDAGDKLIVYETDVLYLTRKPA